MQNNSKQLNHHKIIIRKFQLKISLKTYKLIAQTDYLSAADFHVNSTVFSFLNITMTVA